MSNRSRITEIRESIVPVIRRFMQQRNTPIFSNYSPTQNAVRRSQTRSQTRSQKRIPMRNAANNNATRTKNSLNSPTPRNSANLIIKKTSRKRKRNTNNEN